MPYIVIEKNTKKTDGYGHGHQDLSLYSSLEFDKEYTVMSQIRMRQDIIHGSLKYDKRMKIFLLQAINDFNGCALINNESLSDETYYFFDIVSLDDDCELKNDRTPGIIEAEDRNE